MNRKFYLSTTAAIAAVAFSSEMVETVFIKGDDGNPARINASDYDEKKHGKQINPKDGQADAPVITANTVISSPDGMAATPPSPMAINTQPTAPIEPGSTSTAAELASVERVPLLTPAPEPTAPVQRNVAKIGRKFFVTDPAGNKVESDAFEASGYSSEGDAWGAVAAEQAAISPAPTPTEPTA